MVDLTQERISQLLADIHSAPSPEESFSKWMFVDIFVIDGLMMMFTILLMVIRDLYFMGMIGAFSIAFGAVYLYVKNEAKKKLSLGLSFLDSQTIIGDLEIAEQIPIEGYEYIILPEHTIEGKDIRYTRRDLDEVTQKLTTSIIRFGGESMLRPQVVDELVTARLRELRDIEQEKREEWLAKQAEKKAKKRPKRDEEYWESEEEEEEEAVTVKRPKKKGFWGRFGRKPKRIGDADDEVSLFSPMDEVRKRDEFSYFSAAMREEEEKDAKAKGKENDYDRSSY